jgi:uncharacterized protein (DUF433 family)
MDLVIEPQSVPLHKTAEGAVRVVGTRIGLDVVVAHFNSGKSPESIAASMPALSLGDTYSVLAFYLRHREAVDEYLAEQDREADALQAKVEAHPTYQQLRERLMARRSPVANQP